MAPDENAAPETETATEVSEEEVAEVAAEVKEQTKDEVYDEAKELGVKGRSKMDKEELVGAVSDAKALEEADEEEADERVPQVQPEFAPSMTDAVQARMNAGIAQGQEARRATIQRNQARKREQHAAIHATNRPGPSEPAADEEE